TGHISASAVSSLPAADDYRGVVAQRTRVMVRVLADSHVVGGRRRSSSGLSGRAVALLRAWNGAVGAAAGGGEGWEGSGFLGLGWAEAGFVRWIMWRGDGVGASGWRLVVVAGFMCGFGLLLRWAALGGRETWSGMFGM
ncbi:hypothetical protein CONLIGDRAFT_687645, partial [Coniochaeta ligniaria NRRL 30616]